MRVICILCDQIFEPDKWTEKKIKKHPHLIQICPDCRERIKQKTLKREEKADINP